MPEKINGQGFRPSEAATTRRSERARQPDTEAASASRPKASSGDTVNLTPSAMLLNRLAEVVGNAPATDAAKVRAAKDAIASGTYEIDYQMVADKMLRLDRELLA